MAGALFRVFLSMTFLLVPLTSAAQSGDTAESKSGGKTQATDDRSARYRALIEDFRWKGFTPSIGVVASGSGLAAGVRFASPAFTPLDLSLTVDTRLSVRNYQQLVWRLGRVGSRRTTSGLAPADSSPTASLRFTAADPGWTLYVESRYLHLPSLSLFGTSDAQTVRADFGQRLRSTDLVYHWQLTPRLGVAARVGRSTSHIFRGTNDDLPDAEVLFGTEIGFEAEDKVRYVTTGVAAGWDLRDKPQRPQGGAALSAGVWRYTAHTEGAASFTRLTLDGRVYRRMFSDRHLLACRLVGAYSTAGGGREIPFSTLQSLGGSGSLRSFASYRFRGRHLTLAVVEWRWRLKNWLELVPFAEVGRVAGQPLGPPGVHTEVSTGIGARVWLSDELAFRTELGTGSDGSRLVATFARPF